MTFEDLMDLSEDQPDPEPTIWVTREMLPGLALIGIREGDLYGHGRVRVQQLFEHPAELR